MLALHNLFFMESPHKIKEFKLPYNITSDKLTRINYPNDKSIEQIYKHTFQKKKITNMTRFGLTNGSRSKYLRWKKKRSLLEYVDTNAACRNPRARDRLAHIPAQKKKKFKLIEKRNLNKEKKSTASGGNRGRRTWKFLEVDRQSRNSRNRSLICPKVKSNP